MEASNSSLKLIVEECCRSLHYDAIERQFSFPLQNSLQNIWDKIKDEIHRKDSTFHLADFNRTLSQLMNLSGQHHCVPCHEICDNELLPGEAIEIKFKSDQPPMVMLKMQAGQYLDRNSGRGMTLGKHVVFSDKECPIRTAENELIGECVGINLWEPDVLHIVVSQIFLGYYYRYPINDSLWTIFDEAQAITQFKGSYACGKLLNMARKMGVGAFPLLNILNAVTSHAHENDR